MRRGDRLCRTPALSVAGERGVSLVEVIVATGLLAVALVTLAQLFAIAIRSNIDARTATYAALLAQSKVEELRASPGLTISPESALREDTPGFVDYVDQFGHLADGLPHARYVRRWAVQPLMTEPDAVVIQVAVSPKGPQLSGGDQRVPRPGEAYLVTLGRVAGAAAAGP